MLSYLLIVEGNDTGLGLLTCLPFCVLSVLNGKKAMSFWFSSVYSASVPSDSVTAF